MSIQFSSSLSKSNFIHSTMSPRVNVYSYNCLNYGRTWSSWNNNSGRYGLLLNERFATLRIFCHP